MKKKIYDDDGEIGTIETWDDIINKPFKIMLTVSLVKKLELPLYCDDNGIWWLEVNKNNKVKK